jgi:hypothetical protein
VGSTPSERAAVPCSVTWQQADVPAWGTAAHADVVVAIEQNGPWGRSAATQSHLDPDLGARLDAHIRALGGRLLLVRRPGRHAGGDERPVRRCFVARTGPSGWMVTTDLPDPATLLELTAETVRDDEAAAQAIGGSIGTAPVLLVCTNGRRDACCAVRGRPLAHAAAAVHPEQVWEVTHTGGHRFAPTAILLPWGRMLARLHPALADQVLAEARHGRLALETLGPRHDRGGMHLTPHEQAAEAFLREAWGAVELTTALPPMGAQVRVDVVSGPPLPVSCGREPEPSTWFVPAWSGTPAPPPRSSSRDGAQSTAPPIASSSPPLSPSSEQL